MEREFLLREAQAMAPLVRHVLRDVLEARSQINSLARDVDLMRDCRAARGYELRKRLYHATDALEVQRNRLDAATEELESLGVELIDPDRGVAGFPFTWAPRIGSSKVRKATFLLKLNGDKGNGIASWRFEGERTEHRIPQHWLEETSNVDEPGEVGSLPER